ncbi:MAG TPA: FAD:protein FMN transferase [Thermoanaerobaculia bacterium]
MFRWSVGVALMAVSGAPAAASERPLATAERSVAVMGTTLDLAVRMETRGEALGAAERAVAEVRRIEDLLTTWRDSPLAALNRAPVGVEVALSPELTRVLADVFAWTPRTDGAFDPTILPLVKAWDLRGSGRIPNASELDAGRRAMGARAFRIDTARGAAVRLDGNAGIDEGAWGKGYALERALELLRKAGATNAMLNLGGEVAAMGKDPEAKDWTVSLAHPRRRQQRVAVLALADSAISTSGNSERAREFGGRTIGHLLDPKTGEPAPDFGSVSVIAPSPFVADVLSTAFFVLGPRKGLSLSERLRGQGVPHETLYLIERGDGLEAAASPGIDAIVVSADPAVHGLNPAHP